MATSRLELDEEEARRFRDNVTRLQKFLVLRDDEKSRNTLSLLLDELLSIESSVCVFHKENEGSELLAHLACLVPLHLDRIVAKVCYIIVNFCVHKNVVLATFDLQVLVKFLTDSLHQCPSFVHTEILSALCAVCENNTYRIEKFHDVLVGGRGILLQLTDDTTCEDELVVEAVRCLAIFTFLRPNHADCIEVRYVSASFDTFVHLLHRAPHMKMDAHMRHKLLMYCFNGIQNIVTIKRLPNIELGILFAALRAYMFYGMTNQTLNIPSQLYPNMVTPYEPVASSKSSSDAGSRKEVSRPSNKTESARDHGKNETATTREKSRNKKLRKKKGRWQDGNEGDKEAANSIEDDRISYSPSGISRAWSDPPVDPETQNWEMNFLKLGSSDSEYSDMEGGRVRQQKTEMVRVRQSALNCFLNIVRVIDKKVMFGFWSSFIPDVRLTATTPQLQQSLFTTILKDPSPRCRMAAVASLTSLLESAKPFLAAAEEISTHQSAFTPFSVILGSMVREMHRCLLQALVAENFKSVIIQIIKCLANLVNNVPYHRLNHGMLTRVLKQIRHFYNHKDPNVRTACLTCIGAIIGIKPPLLEVSQLIKTAHNPIGVNRSVNPSDSPLFRPEDASYLLYPSFATPQVPSVLEESPEAAHIQSEEKAVISQTEAANIQSEEKAIIGQTEAAHIQSEEKAIIGQTEAAHIQSEEKAIIGQTEAAQIQSEEKAIIGQTEAAHIQSEEKAIIGQTEAAQIPSEEKAVIGQTEAAHIQSEEKAIIGQTEAAHIQSEEKAAIGQTEAAQIPSEEKAIIGQTEAAHIQSEEKAVIGLTGAQVDIQSEEKAVIGQTGAQVDSDLPYFEDSKAEPIVHLVPSADSFTEGSKNTILLNDLKSNSSSSMAKSGLEVSETTQEVSFSILDQLTQTEHRAATSGSSLDRISPVLPGMDTPVHSLQVEGLETSWVIKLCIKNIMDPPCEENQAKCEAPLRYEPLPVRLEALQVMSNLVRNYFPVIRQSFGLLKDLVQACLKDSNHIIKLHGVKVLDEFTQALQKDAKDASTLPVHVIPFQQILEFWMFLLEGPLPLLLNFNLAMSMEGNNLVRSGACECVANVGEEVFAKLPLPRQMQCVTLVLGLAADEDKLIRATAIRAVGVYVMYSGLKEDVAFVLEAAKSVLSCMKCPSNSVRFKSAWAMANLCDTLVNNKDQHVEDFVANFPDDILLQLVHCAATSTRDSDKISCNAARAIGNLLRYMPAHCFLQPDMEKAIDTAVKGLVKNMNSGTMKVRWNSCYAASNAFQNTDLPTDRAWVTDILNMLSKVVQNCSNFKVRINAALGLSTPAGRPGFGSGETFSHVWTSLVCALETAENINDFAEYKYKDSLTEHLCGAVLHLTSLVELADLCILARGVHVKGHSFRTYMEKYIKLELAKPGQDGIHSIERVKDHLEKLELVATSDDQRRCLQSLLQTCVPDTDSADERTPEKTAFQQIYD